MSGVCAFVWRFLPSLEAKIYVCAGVWRFLQSLAAEIYCFMFYLYHEHEKSKKIVHVSM